MAAEHLEVMPSPLDKVTALITSVTDNKITVFKQMGRLFGIEDGQFSTIGELESHLKSLSEDPQIKTGEGVEEVAARKFLTDLNAMLNDYKKLILTKIKEKEGNLKHD